MSSEAVERIRAVVRNIPEGRVATYGQIAALAGLPRRARLVGHALRDSDALGLPWHRVINARGEVSARGDVVGEELQRELLAGEGVALGANGRVSLAAYRWQPRKPDAIPDDPLY